MASKHKRLSERAMTQNTLVMQLVRSLSLVRAVQVRPHSLNYHPIGGSQLIDEQHAEAIAQECVSGITDGSSHC